MFDEETVMPRKVLVVEDICELLELLGKVLASRGWDAILADSGRKALNKLEYDSPSVIFLDMRLPDIAFSTLEKRLPYLVSAARQDQLRGRDYEPRI